MPKLHSAFISCNGRESETVCNLEADIVPNAWGGMGIQHTGSCGESTTMLHHLKIEWMGVSASK